MRGFGTIYRLTLAEARRRKILLATFACGLAFLGLFALGFHFLHRDIVTREGLDALKQRMMLGTFVLAGMFGVNFLSVMTAVLMPVDSISGEIASGVMQTLASKPVRRSTLVLGKWAAHLTVTAAYLGLMAGGVLGIARVLGGVTPPGVPAGLALMGLECAVLMTLSIAGGTRLSTVTNGIAVLGLYGLGFLGGWTEQIGTLAGNAAARSIGTAVSLVIPAESMWQLAEWHMQPSVVRELNLTPFSPASVPSPAMVAWACGYVVVTLLLALRWFSKRPL